MYAYLKGTLEEIAEDAVVVEVGNIGYNVRVSATTTQGLPGIGSEVKIYTYTLVREDAFTLYGFLTKDDLEIFKKLITVNGIGPKGGLAILSVMNADALRFAIMAGDAKSIAKAPGVGNKTAERVILDLRDKISLEDTLLGLGEPVVTASAAGGGADNVMKREAIEALVALGYSASDATNAVKRVEVDENSTVEGILKAALKFMF
ncbi:MAG: Holliday junction branch migration protein RuvA [Lachnospiraceae bacterium]|jgi:Holliday junction DNA helicase RuvA|nr:Holliday junction branch migration protein RuvA [uncultured Schaedlerella sp.]MCI8988013.1 Holliday junction branch migration protein RuvA [Lachnospiraceae bacterium]MCI9255659.1 Holliday junction branch migration protein RuvA [Lachnospiraceae bacterium]